MGAGCLEAQLATTAVCMFAKAVVVLKSVIFRLVPILRQTQVYGYQHTKRSTPDSITAVRDSTVLCGRTSSLDAEYTTYCLLLKRLVKKIAGGFITILINKK